MNPNLSSPFLYVNSRSVGFPPLFINTYSLYLCFACFSERLIQLHIFMNIMKTVNYHLSQFELNSLAQLVFFKLIEISNDGKPKNIFLNDLSDHMAKCRTQVKAAFKQLNAVGLITAKTVKIRKNARLVSNVWEYDLNLPSYIKNLLFFQKVPFSQYKLMRFYGTPISEQVRVYNGQLILCIRLANVCSTDRHVYFDFHWVPKDSVVSSESDKVSFYAYPDVSDAEQLMLSVTQPHIGQSI